MTVTTSIGSGTGSSTRQNRKSIYDVAGLNPVEKGYGSSTFRGRAGLRANSAVGRILGGDLVERIRRAEGSGKTGKGEIDVAALLDGAERLCEV